MEYNVHVRIYSARLRGKNQKSIQDSPPGRILQPQINAIRSTWRISTTGLVG